MTRSMLQVAIVLLLAAAYSLAARIPRATVAPTIISPSGLSQWPSGTVETVKWVSDQDLTGLNGTIYMGYIQPDGNPFLWKDQPLAENFSLADGVVNIRVPLNLPTGFRYVVSLSIDGDDSDISGVFGVVDRTVQASTTLPPPATLSTTGGVPPATITRTSVVSTIGLPTSSATSSDLTTPSSSNTAASTATQPSPTNTGGNSNGAGSAHGLGASVLLTIAWCTYTCIHGFVF
ncbi:uncharacterized protein TRAVEDRAFT_46381 [Trametes versicolor FP-101664 SS1]|uniref:uncharacterized protein n=1 Tax=Trametes versicolor (strain FP-101664) TaxID=717944 RepID=UPI0004621F9B|nr:uncharacterized protein TRAVEDRAFT_46381 [Trametes versicolor FP-101664 SS1]EIW59070.1 hypothetical protein TRAVEDRAFT_46381 [Trametes versicolor FP-101664 SS1]